MRHAERIGEERQLTVGHLVTTKMVGRAAARAGGAIVLSAILAGCFSPGGQWRFPSLMRSAPPPAPVEHRYTPPPPPAPLPPPAARPPVPQLNERSYQGATERQSAKPVPPAAEQPPAEASPKPSVTLADGGASKSRAIHLLKDANAKLARIDRSKLSGDNATTYDQANNFLQAGRKAADEQDYVAAWGYAEKASVLATKLSPNSP